MSNSFDSAILPPPRPTATASVGITSDQRTAGGPLPGNHNIAMEEAKCAAAQNNPRWYPTLVPAELRDSNRTKLFARSNSYCADEGLFGTCNVNPNTVIDAKLYDIVT